MGEVYIVGLGPGGWEYLPEKNRQALLGADRLIVRTSRHPIARELVADGALSCDDLYEEIPEWEDLYEAIAQRVVSASLQGSVAYAVPGSPFVAERAATLVKQRVKEARVLPAISCVDLALERLGVDAAASGVRIGVMEDAADLLADLSAPLLLLQASTREDLEVLFSFFSETPDFELTLLKRLSMEGEQVLKVPAGRLYEVEVDDYTTLYVPPRRRAALSELANLLDITAILRMKCPWDRRQTHQSLAPYLIEEAYEAVDALSDADGFPAHFIEELGDVLFQVLIHSQIASEEGLFDLGEVAQALSKKLVARHPHVFGAEEVQSAEEVAARWEEFKQRSGGSRPEGPPPIPSLSLLTSLLRKAGEDRLRREVQSLKEKGEIGGQEAALFEHALEFTARSLRLGKEPELFLRQPLSLLWSALKDRRQGGAGERDSRDQGS